MKKGTRLKTGPVALLVLLALLTLLVVIRKDLTAGEAEEGAVWTVVKVHDAVVRHKRAAVASLALLVVFAFVTWTALRAREGEDKAMPPAGEPGEGGTAEFR